MEFRPTTRRATTFKATNHPICNSIECLDTRKKQISEQSRKNMNQYLENGGLERMKTNNPIWNQEVKNRAMETKKETGFIPFLNGDRGGNGRAISAPQLTLLLALGDGWYAEFVVATRLRSSGLGYPTCYKIDIAHPDAKIAIEVDGESHNSNFARARDMKKTTFLDQQGWKVFRFKNAEALTETAKIVQAMSSFII